MMIAAGVLVVFAVFFAGFFSGIATMAKHVAIEDPDFWRGYFNSSREFRLDKYRASRAAMEEGYTRSQEDRP